MSDGAEWEKTIEQLKAFLVTALGEPEPEYAGSPSAFDGITAPAALRSLHEFAANWPCVRNGSTWLLFGGYWPQNMLLTPDNWYVEDGYTIFASENQGVCSWAFATEHSAEPSPIVVSNIESWEDSNEESLADFLLAWCMSEVSSRRRLHGTARVLRLVEPMNPDLVANSSTFGTLSLYSNNVLTIDDGRGLAAACVGLDDPEVALGDAAETYRAVTVRFRHDKRLWRIVLDEFGGGRVTINFRYFDVRGVLPTSFFDELFSADAVSESGDSRLAHFTAAEPKAEIVSNRAHTIRNTGYIPDELTRRLLDHFRTLDELAPLIAKLQLGESE